MYFTLYRYFSFRSIRNKLDYINDFIDNNSIDVLAISGDFNLHVNNQDNHQAMQFIDCISDYSIK